MAHLLDVQQVVWLSKRDGTAAGPESALPPYPDDERVRGDPFCCNWMADFPIFAVPKLSALHLLGVAVLL